MPKGGVLLPAPCDGEVQLSLPAPQNYTGAGTREVTAACGWEGASSCPFGGCFPPMSLRATLLQSLRLVGVHQGSCDTREMPPLLMPLAPAGTRGWQWVKKELVLTAGEVQQRSCLSQGPRARLLWLGCLLCVRAELTQAKGDQQKRVVFLIRNPTGMK